MVEEPALRLAEFRARIDAVDARLVGVLAERMALVQEVAAFKRAHAVDPHQPGRMQEIFARVRALGAERGLDPGFVEGLWRAIIDEAMRIEREALGGAEGARARPRSPKGQG